MRHLLHKLIVWYLRRCAGAFHAYPYGPDGRYVVLMTDREFGDYRRPTGELARALAIRPEVLQFALLMERELQAHDDRPGWKDECPMYLLDRLREEVQELVAVVIMGDVDRVPGEAADVLNFVMMVCDVVGALSMDEQKEIALDAIARGDADDIWKSAHGLAP